MTIYASLSHSDAEENLKEKKSHSIIIIITAWLVA